MSKRESNFPRREILGIRLGFMLRRRVLAGIAAVSMGASLVFSPSASAHNIDLEKTREAVRNYARLVRDEPGRNYVRYSTNCLRAFPGGHNHIVRCLIDYENEADAKKGVYTCRESIEVKFLPHDRSTGLMTYVLYASHTSYNQCGNRRLSSTMIN